MTTNLPALLDRAEAKIDRLARIRGEAARAEWLRWVRYRGELLDAVAQHGKEQRDD